MATPNEDHAMKTYTQASAHEKRCTLCGGRGHTAPHCPMRGAA